MEVPSLFLGHAEKRIDLLFICNYNSYKITINNRNELYFFNIIVTVSVTIKINHKTTKKCKNFKWQHEKGDGDFETV
ncbi:hypothetical protein [Bacillus cereus group sp. BfR-BA-01316]|uniref:hypothetical protein n=1 Tax=Bacillus cereus group sp. BfR-BA-01316 TaxID=2920293 RepID=UPI001F59BB24|nr:hypothetical protein [Bacillus cereus group sp. BfR-BA-01316]